MVMRRMGSTPYCVERSFRATLVILTIFRDIAQAAPKAAVDRLVAQYERLFGRASHEVCREAVASIIAKMSVAEVPSSLLA
jgi:hypothetical protein